jgi:hypothetical protein
MHAASDVVDARARATGSALARWWPVLLVAALLFVPLVAGCVWLYQHDRGAPLFELAFTEMRVRDVGTQHTPLVGLNGRLAVPPDVGCHLGPASFYLLAPVYRLLGASYFALRVSHVTLNAGAIVLALWLARRRAGTPGVLALGVVLGMLMLGFGLQVLTEPWNAFLPTLWFVPFLLATWSVLDGDEKLLPVAAALACICGQTHIPYLPVCGALGVLAALVVLGRWAGAVRRRNPTRRFWQPVLVALGVAALFWAPPIVDELWASGNLSLVFGFLSHPREATVGIAEASALLVQRLDVYFLLSAPLKTPGLLRVPLAEAPSTARGALVVAVWLLSAGVALRLRQRTLLALHATTAAAVAVAVASVSRIAGIPWLYLLFFGWSIGGLVLLSILGSAGCWLRTLRPALSARWYHAAAAFGLVLTATLVLRLAASDRSSLESRAPATQLTQLASMAARALQQGIGAADGADGLYFVSWQDGVYYGDQGHGMANELERRGLRAFVEPGYVASVGAHRVIEPQRATAQIHLATGGWIEVVRNAPGAVEIAHAGLRTRELEEERARILAQLRATLAKIKQPDLLVALDRDRRAMVNSALTGWDHLQLMRLHDIGEPASVFVLPLR